MHELCLLGLYGKSFSHFLCTTSYDMLHSVDSGINKCSARCNMSDVHVSRAHVNNPGELCTVKQSAHPHVKAVNFPWYKIKTCDSVVVFFSRSLLFVCTLIIIPTGRPFAAISGITIHRLCVKFN